MKRCILLSALLVLVIANPAIAQTYPDRKVTIVVPFAAGGGVDTVARPIAEGLRRILKQPFVVENRAGAASNIGTEQVARSEPDGYSALINLDIIAAFPHLYSNLQYDVLKDLKPVGYLASAPMVLAVHPSLPVNTVEDLIKLAKENPEKLTFAIPGLGTPHHLAFELLSYKAGFKVRTVSYRGGAPALNDVLGGHVQIGVFTIGTVVSHIEAGKLKPLAVTSEKRAAVTPNIPSIGEAGYPSAQVTNRYVMMVPSKTPPKIIQTLNAAINGVVNEADVVENFRRQGFESMKTTPAEAEKLFLEENQRWAPVIKGAGIKLD